MSNLTSDGRCIEPCYCKRCRGEMPAPCKYRGKNWLQLLCLRIWCTLDGHGGITTYRHGYMCKRCGDSVRLI